MTTGSPRRGPQWLLWTNVLVLAVVVNVQAYLSRKMAERVRALEDRFFELRKACRERGITMEDSR